MAALLSVPLRSCPEFGDLVPNSADYYGYPMEQSSNLAPIPLVPESQIARAIERLEEELPKQDPLFLAAPLLRRLRRQAPSIVGVGENIAASGVQNYGVFRVTSAEGKEIALKISSEHTAEQLRYALLIQDILADMDLAPRVLGLVEGRKLDRLLQEFNIRSRLDKNQKKRRPFTGILMEEVRGGWNFRLNHDPPPAWLKTLDRESVITQMRHIAHILDRLGIKGMDTQFMITSDSRVRLIDLDLFLVRRGSRWLGKQQDAGLEKRPGNSIQEEIKLFNRLYNGFP